MNIVFFFLHSPDFFTKMSYEYRFLRSLACRNFYDYISKPNPKRKRLRFANDIEKFLLIN